MPTRRLHSPNQAVHVIGANAPQHDGCSPERNEKTHPTIYHANPVHRCDRRHCDWVSHIPAFFPGIDFSDHINYWPLGLDALMITDTAFYRNREYHTSGDTGSPGLQADV
jgi:hypothetical protein